MKHHLFLKVDFSGIRGAVRTRAARAKNVFWGPIFGTIFFGPIFGDPFFKHIFLWIHFCLDPFLFDPFFWTHFFGPIFVDPFFGPILF